MSESKRTSSFWTTLPGILTGLAGMITAVGTLVAVILQLSGPAPARGGGNPGAAPPARTTTVQTVSWASEANRLCGDTLEEVRALGTPETPDEILDFLPRVVDVNWRLHAELRALPVAADEADAVESLLGKLAAASDRAEGVVLALESFDQAGAVQQWSELRVADSEFDDAAIAIGASACAQD